MPITLYHQEDGTIVGMSAAPADAPPIEMAANPDDDSAAEAGGCIRSIRIEGVAGSALHFDSSRPPGELFDEIVRAYRVEHGCLVTK